ncbi:MAG: hypothetical protein ACI8ZF_000734 [Candidatus Midichloriaceae bacterium]|jgi:hypothetical protein
MRLILILLVLFCTSNCGFKPLHYVVNGENMLSSIEYVGTLDKEKNPTATFFLNKEVDKILSTYDDRTKIKYILSISYDVDIDDYLIQSNSYANRKKVTVKMMYKISDIYTKDVVVSGTLMDFESFAITESPYSDYVVEEDLITATLLSLVQELRVQLIAKMADKIIVKD